MATKPTSSVRQVGEHSYRCPACGETVDARQIDDVRRHHRHVLDAHYSPGWFNLPAQTSQRAVGGEDRAEQPMPAEAPERPADKWVRRYGHSEK